MKYKTKSNIIEAVQWTGDNLEECKLFCSAISGQKNDMLETLWLGGPLFIFQKDWIIRTEDGRYKHLTDEEFCGLYEPMKG